jgi:hypothetical protein
MGSRVRQGVGPHAALAVDGDAHDALAAQAEQAERFDDGLMHLFPDDDRDGRRAEKAVGFNVPTGALEQCVPRGGQG